MPSPPEILDSLDELAELFHKTRRELFENNKLVEELKQKFVALSPPTPTEKSE